MKAHVTRRRFLKTAGAAASVTILSPSLLKSEFAFGAPPLYTRRDIGNLKESDPIILSYRKAVKAMQALPNNDPVSWTYQAAIHGNSILPPQVAWNTCQHGTYFFWSWHRMYLYYFERIVRRMSGDCGWTLPYWNWELPSERQLPPAFRDTTSELFTTHRNAAMNSGAGSLSAGTVNTGPGMSLVPFNSASSSLEGTPHGAVHVSIGGWMGSVPTAGQDPIFYLHHCNLDRLWNLWIAQGGGRNDPLGDATWKNTQFTFFDELGTQVKMTSCQVLRCAQQLDYVYEVEPAQVNKFCLNIVIPFPLKEIVVRFPIPPIILKDNRIRVPIDVRRLKQRLTSLAENKDSTLFLTLDGVEAERQPGVIWEVYLGLPAGKEPDPDGPYFVGNVVLFGTGIKSDKHNYKPASFNFPIDRTIATVLKESDGATELTFVPTGILVNGRQSMPKPDASVTIARASITVETERK